MELQQDKDIVAIITMSAGFGKHTHLVWAYVEIFGVTPMRDKAKKIRVILEEMKGLFDSGAFKYEKRKYEISQAGIAEALNVVVHRHFSDHLEKDNLSQESHDRDLRARGSRIGEAGRTRVTEARRQRPRAACG